MLTANTTLQKCYSSSVIVVVFFVLSENHDYDLSLILLTWCINWHVASTKKYIFVGIYLLPQCSLKVMPFWNILSKVKRTLGEFKNLSWVPLSPLPKTLFLISGDRLLEVFMIYTLLLLIAFLIFLGILFLGCSSVPEGGPSGFSKDKCRWISTLERK